MTQPLSSALLDHLSALRVDLEHSGYTPEEVDGAVQDAEDHMRAYLAAVPYATDEEVIADLVGPKGTGAVAWLAFLGAFALAACLIGVATWLMGR